MQREETYIEETVFTLNNTGIHNTYITTTFSCFEILLSHPESKVHDYMKKLGYFMREDFILLHFRISIEKINEVRMRLKHVIIMYAVIHFVCKSFLDEDEEIILTNAFGDIVEFKEVRDKVLVFGRVSTDMLKKRFIDDERFNMAVENILEY